MAYDSTLLMREFVTHDVKRLMVSRPEGLGWKPGQGVKLSIDNPEWRDQPRPFTPTSLSEDRVIELTVKVYPEQDGVTEALHALEPGAALKLSEPFGSITYQGPGTFLAAGTGVTPFLAILRRLVKDGEPLEGHRLLVSNKCERDLIAAQELRHYLGDDLIPTSTREDASEHKGRHLDALMLESALPTDDSQPPVYICGPDGFVETMKDHLLTLGIHPERWVFEH